MRNSKGILSSTRAPMQWCYILRQPVLLTPASIIVFVEAAGQLWDCVWDWTNLLISGLIFLSCTLELQGTC